MVGKATGTRGAEGSRGGLVCQGKSMRKGFPAGLSLACFKDWKRRLMRPEHGRWKSL